MPGEALSVLLKALFRRLVAQIIRDEAELFEGGFEVVDGTMNEARELNRAEYCRLSQQPFDRRWHEVIMPRTIMGILGLVLLVACTPSILPSKALDGVDPNFDFAQWRMLPHQSQQQKIQLGGRIVQAEKLREPVTIVATQLPLAKDPPHGPEKAAGSGGEFVVLYGAPVDPVFLRTGNRILVVGQISPPVEVTVGDGRQRLPTVTALCIHFWHTGPEDIKFQGSSGGDSQTVRELTYCKTAL